MPILQFPAPYPFATLPTMKNTWLFALLLWMFVLPTARSQDKTPDIGESGNTFLLECGDMMDRSASPAFEIGLCFGYLRGVKDGFRMAFRIENLKPPYCIPDEATAGQLASILIKYIKDHPEKAHFETMTLEVASLVNAFPCKAEAKKK
jgi:Rap1a immunity proteins